MLAPIDPGRVHRTDWLLPTPPLMPDTLLLPSWPHNCHHRVDLLLLSPHGLAPAISAIYASYASSAVLAATGSIVLTKSATYSDHVASITSATRESSTTSASWAVPCEVTRFFKDTSAFGLMPAAPFKNDY